MSEHGWTGPWGPKLLRTLEPSQIEECAQEIKQIASWSKLSMSQPEGWRVDWRSYSLHGYSSDPLVVNSPFTLLHRAVSRGEVAPDTPVRVDPTMVGPTTAAPNFPACLRVANAIPGLNERIRINYLGPRGVIPRHRDPLHAERWEERTIVRFHIPVILPRGCEFFAWDRGEQCHWVCRHPGEVWFIDTDAPHMVVNASLAGRYNLVVDKFLTDELRELLTRGHTLRPF